MIDLKTLSDSELHRLEGKIYEEKQRRSGDSIKKREDKLNSLIGRYFKHQNTKHTQYFRPTSRPDCSYVISNAIFEGKEGAWDVQHSDYCSLESTEDWTEVTKEDLEAAKEQLIQNATKDWRENL